MPPVALLHSLDDLVSHLSDYCGGDGIDRGLRDYRRAAQLSYIDTTLSNEWKAYLTRGRINLNAVADTGTVSFDLTGGSYERMVTLTGFTWPTWAPYGTLLIDGVRYKVDEYKSNTIVTLMYDSCPTADIAAGTSYTLYQNVYPLPEDFRRSDGAHFQNGLGCLRPIELSQWLHLDQQEAQSGRPYLYAIGGSPDSWQYGKMALYVYPYPDEAESIDFLYWRNPRPLYYTGQETEAKVGTVTGTAGSATVTGGSTTFTAKMVGSLIRFSRSPITPPEGLGGGNPYQEQRVIIAVASATSLTVDSGLDFTYSPAVKYMITDPVDADGALLVALYRNAEKHLDIFRHPDRVPIKQAMYAQAWKEALERDQRLNPSDGLYGMIWQSGGTIVTSTDGDTVVVPDPGGGAAVPELLFSQTSIETVFNNLSEDNLSGTGDGSLTLAANSWIVGEVIRVRASGTYGTKATTAGTLSLRLKYGSTVLNLLTVTMPDNQSTKAWFLDSSLTRHSIGPTGTVSGVGIWQYAVTGEASLQSADDPIANEVLASDASQIIELTADWQFADTANTITCSQLTVEKQGAV